MNRRVVPLVGLFVFFVFAATGCSSTPARQNDSALRRLSRQKPSSELAPREVVRIQMEALKYNDEKNRGIEIVFRFASPSNKLNTGPLPRFINMMNGEAYRPMLNHNTIEYDRVRLAGEQALQRVSITTDDGLIVVYVFVLSKQQGEQCSGCWMTDAVYVESMQKASGIV